jgi:hypothetical protein
MGRVNDGQFGTVCPQCGSAAAVHSIDELAALARNQLGQQQGNGPTPQAGYNPPTPSYNPPTPSYNPPTPSYSPPSPDYDPPGNYNQQPPGYNPPSDYNPPPQGGYGPPPPPGYQGPPPPGYTGSARPGQPSQSGQPMRSSDWPGIGDVASSLEDGVADVVLGAAARFVGRAISRRVQRTVNERVLPALAVKHDAVMREQIAIAERHPDLRACLTDKVIFLAGGQRVLPMPSLAGGFTVEQSDAVVARLRDG